MAGAEEEEPAAVVAAALDEAAVVAQAERTGVGGRDPALEAPVAEGGAGGEGSHRLGRGEGFDRAEIGRVEALDEDRHAPAAALAEIGAEDDVVERRDGVGRREGRLGERQRPPFERAAADGAAKAEVGTDQHVGAHLARGRAADGGDAHTDETSVRFERGADAGPAIDHARPPESG